MRLYSRDSDWDCPRLSQFNLVDPFETVANLAAGFRGACFFELTSEQGSVALGWSLCASRSRYEAGKRTGAWLKNKLYQEQEFVIGAYTEPEGSRKHFGALLIGFYEDKKSKFIGRVGTGFSKKKQT